MLPNAESDARSRVEAALADVVSIVRLDGADLVLREVGDAAVHLDLTLGRASCSDCVMPRATLENVIRHALSEKLDQFYEVTVADPRLDGFSGLESESD